MQVLVWKNKYNDAIYDASTPEKLEAAARRILKTLVDDNWVNPPSELEFSEDENEAMAMTAAEVDALPTVARVSVGTMRERVATRMRRYTEDFEEFENILSAIEGKYRMSPWRSKTNRYRDDEWEEVLEFASTNWPDSEISKDRLHVLRPVTAWQILDSRTGFEYETYSLENVISA